MGGFPRDRGVSPPGRAPGRGTRGDPAAHTWPLARVQAESRLGPLDVPGRGTGDDPAEGRGRGHLRASHWCVQSPTGTAGLSAGHRRHGDRCHSNLHQVSPRFGLT